VVVSTPYAPATSNVFAVLTVLSMLLSVTEPWRAALGEVLVVADNRYDLRVGVRNREYHSINTMIESVVQQLGKEALFCAEMPAAPMGRTRRVELHRKDCFGRLEKRGKDKTSGENLEPGNNVRKIPRSTYMPLFVASRQG
jgi:hypothetical protein